MTEVSRDTITQLRFEFYKSILTFALATLGGEITLLNSVFKEATDKGLAYASIVVMVFASLCVLAAKETLIKRLDPLPVRGSIDKIINAVEFTSAASERLMESLSEILFGVSLVLFVLFVLRH